MSLHFGQDWFDFFRDAGIPDERAQKYAASVVEKERTGFMFQELNSRDSLRDLGIVICQDVLDIVQHAKRMCENEEECDARGAGDSKIQNKMEVEVRKERKSPGPEVVKDKVDVTAEPGPSTSAPAAAPPAASGDSAGLFQEDMLTNFKEFVDNHLSCIVCSEIMVFPSTVIACGHTFCNMCIKKWNKKSANCPICRSRINDIIPNVALESYLEKVAETFFPEDAKSARKVLHEQRAAQRDVSRRKRQRSRESSPAGRRRILSESEEELDWYV